MHGILMADRYTYTSSEQATPSSNQAVMLLLFGTPPQERLEQNLQSVVVLELPE
jgi:hypothetical protein